MEREETPAPADVREVLGTLYLVKRSTGEDLSSMPIDGERMTIGKDWDCDIRIYFDDVSNIHCELLFDLLTNQASLHVHGRAGVYYAPLGLSPKKYDAGAVIPLADKDTFIIRKKLFRFEYGNTDPINVDILHATPAVASPAATAATGKRRTSHRMSLVPMGRDFQRQSQSPAKAKKSRRSSVFGTTSAARSGLNNEITREEVREEDEEQQQQEQQNEDEDMVVDMAEGEDGDVIYLERKEEMGKPIFNNAFMTPQPARKAPMPTNTVAPARTMIAAPPKITASVAMSTPKGSASLRKALLLRSARKTWAQTRSPGIDGAIEEGKVEVRRKSLSPKVREKSSPKAVAAASEEESEEEAEDDDDEDGDGHLNGEEALEAEEEMLNNGELQWVYEDGKGEGVSFASESSGDDSLEADVSLDIPGEQILDFATPTKEGHRMDVDEHDEQDHEAEKGAAPSEPTADSPTPALPGTPAARRALERFYTPQLRRQAGPTGPRRSLAAIGGPPVRFNAQPKTPNSAATGLVHGNQAHGTMGKPSRRTTPSVRRQVMPEQEEVEEAPAVKVEADRRLETPRREPPTPAMIAEAKRRRESLATPRALPLPPASGFKTPVPSSTPLRNLHTSHPALRPTLSPEPLEVPSTPMEKLKSQIADFKRLSLTGPKAGAAGRRNTVGFALPSTPLQRPSTMKQSGSYTVARPSAQQRVSFMAPTSQAMPRSFAMPRMSSTKEDDELEEGGSYEVPEELEPTPPRTHQAAGGSSNFPSTPSLATLRHLLRPPVPPPKTPSFAGLKSLYPSDVAVAATPNFSGMREMFSDRRKEMATPRMAGVRGMFEMHQRRGALATPGLEGVGEMFGRDEEEEEVEMVEEEQTGVPEAKSKPSGRMPRVPAASQFKSKASSTASKRTTAAAAPAEDEDTAAAPKKRATTSRSVRRTTTEEPETVPSAPPTRGSRGSRTTRRNTTEEPEVQPPPTMAATSKAPTAKGSKSTRAAKAVVPAPVAEEIAADPPVEAEKPKPAGRGRKTAAADKPSRPSARGKKALEESTDQVVDAAAEVEAPKPAAAKGRKPAATASKKTAAEAPPSEKVSAPSRAAGRKGKENVDEEEQEAKKAPATAKRTAAAVPAGTTRATRSRK